MAKTREQKHADREVLGACFQKASAAVVAEYRGITAEELASLRRELRKVDSEFRVVRNRVALKAIEKESPKSEPISDKLTGPVGVTYIYNDVAEAAKTVLKFANEHDKFQITGGLLDGQSLTAAELKEISELPSKDVLLAKIVGSLVSPHRGLLGVLNGVPSQLVRVLDAIKETKK